APQRAQASCGRQTWHLVFERVFQGRLISPDPQLDFCCSPANSFVLPMCSMMSDLGAPDARSRCEVLSARAPWRPGIGPV
ncbi:hypothetical protein BRN16_25565, partial [Xanthomonas oryzae pv. oryzae]